VIDRELGSGGLLSREIDVASQLITGEAHFARVLQGHAVQAETAKMGELFSSASPNPVDDCRGRNDPDRGMQAAAGWTALGLERSLIPISIWIPISIRDRRD
jgi:hypothetical protein